MNGGETAGNIDKYWTNLKHSNTIQTPELHPGDKVVPV